MNALSNEARLVLHELEAPPATPISAKKLAEHIGTMSPAQVGSYLRELRTAGFAFPLDAVTREPLDRVPPGVRVVWAPNSPETP